VNPASRPLGTSQHFSALFASFACVSIFDHPPGLRKVPKDPSTPGETPATRDAAWRGAVPQGRSRSPRTHGLRKGHSSAAGDRRAAGRQRARREQRAAGRARASPGQHSVRAAPYGAGAVLFPHGSKAVPRPAPRGHGSRGRHADAIEKTQIRGLEHVGWGAKDEETGEAEGRHGNRFHNMAAAETKGVMFLLPLPAGCKIPGLSCSQGTWLRQQKRLRFMRITRQRRQEDGGPPRCWRAAGRVSVCPRERIRGSRRWDGGARPPGLLLVAWRADGSSCQQPAKEKPFSRGCEGERQTSRGPTGSRPRQPPLAQLRALPLGCRRRSQGGCSPRCPPALALLPAAGHESAPRTAQPARRGTAAARSPLRGDPQPARCPGAGVAAPAATAKPTGSRVPQQTGRGRHTSWVNLLFAKGRDSLPGSSAQLKPTSTKGEAQPARPAAGGPTAPTAPRWKPSTLPWFVPETSHGSESCPATDEQKTRSVCLNRLARAPSRPSAVTSPGHSTRPLVLPVAAGGSGPESPLPDPSALQTRCCDTHFFNKDLIISSVLSTYL